MRRKLTRYDIALIVVIIVISVVSIYYNSMDLVHFSNCEAMVYSNNELIGRYILDPNLKMKFTVKTENGNYNDIEIRNGDIWIDSATCSDHICLHQGKINKDGQVIVCLPNKMIIKIKGKSDDVKVDAISQ